MAILIITGGYGVLEPQRRFRHVDDELLEIIQGHITDDWDRTLCRTYLQEYMNVDMVSEI